MVTRDFAKFRDETPNPISLNQRVLGSSPSASTTFPLLFNQILGSPDRTIESIFVLGSSLGSSALIRHCGYSASAHQRSR